ncbi:CYTH and CHAD domain-containing protein [Thiomonas sp.]|uniref:CYTH and CHAD domain-containing protein n=1 Tax=Thiomonas sp. TaxID=2047785 RepID=UPI002624ED19|nr:CYTH and CHAD domain-containing protein [Thiomonas sp.]
MSQERELKFRIDPSQHDALRAHPVLLSLAAAPRSQALQSWYFDTPDHALRDAGLALRVRHADGAPRVLTLKSSPAHGLQLERGEWEFAIDGDVPDVAALQRLQSTPLAALGDAAALAGNLRAVLGTRVQRTAWQVPWQGSLLEVCLDVGQALGGTAADAPALPLSEVEIELLDGQWLHAFDLAWTLAQDIPLLLSPTNKVQMAARAAGMAPWQLPELARSLAPHARGGQALAAALQQAAAVLASGAEMLHHGHAHADTVHQMRLQLRRLRVLLRLLQTTGPQSQRAACKWLRGEWRWAGQLLGAVRDVDVCLQQAASLAEAERPAVHRGLEHKRAARLQALLAYLRSARFGRVLLAQARWAQDWSDAELAAARQPSSQLARRLLRFHRDDLQLHPQRWAELLAIWQGQTASPADAPWEALHVLRLKAKQLRYALEWLAPWVDEVLGKQGRAWLKLTSALQADLGDALDTLRLARWVNETRAAHPGLAASSDEDGVRQAFDLASRGLQRALQAARSASR